MAARLMLWFRMVLISLDQLLHVVLGGPKYIIVGGPPPNPDETISSKVGRASLQGKRWAIVAERFIDFFFGKGHCLASIGK